LALFWGDGGTVPKNCSITKEGREERMLRSVTEEKKRRCRQSGRATGGEKKNAV